MAVDVVQVVIFASSLVALASASYFAIRFIEKLIELTGLSDVSAGFIIIAVMTSTPEILVAIFSIIEGRPGISIGDILGSNIFNIGGILGILGMLGYLKTCCTDRLVELTDILFLTSLIPLLLVIFNPASPFVGAALLGIFFANTYFMTKRSMPKVDAETPKTAGGWGGWKVVFVELSLVMAVIVIAARFVVSSGVEIAVGLGVPTILVGAKVVSIGTSLPELTLDFAAVRRGRVQLAIGDIIGSNLTNLTLVLGLVLLSSPFTTDMTIFTELLPFLLITTIILWRYLLKGGISQMGGMVLMFTYILFQAIIIA